MTFYVMQLKRLLNNFQDNIVMNENKLYQIGLPIEKLSNVHLNWTCYEPRQKMIISPSVKNEGWVVVETRHTEFAAAIINDIPEAKVHVLDNPVKIVKL